MSSFCIKKGANGKILWLLLISSFQNIASVSQTNAFLSAPLKIVSKVGMGESKVAVERNLRSPSKLGSLIGGAVP